MWKEYGTFGSGGVRGQFERVAPRGAQARAMLICAASAIWHVKRGVLHATRSGRVTNRLAAARRTEHWLPRRPSSHSSQSAPQSPDEWRLIGKECRGSTYRPKVNDPRLWIDVSFRAFDRDDSTNRRASVCGFGKSMPDRRWQCEALRQVVPSAMQSQLWLRTTGVLIEPFRGLKRFWDNTERATVTSAEYTKRLRAAPRLAAASTHREVPPSSN